MDNSYDKTTGPSTDVIFFSITGSSEGRKVPQKVLDKIQHIATPTHAQEAHRLTGPRLLEATCSTSSRDPKTITQLLEKQRSLTGHSPTGSPKSEDYLQTFTSLPYPTGDSTLRSHVLFAQDCGTWALRTKDCADASFLCPLPSRPLSSLTLPSKYSSICKTRFTHFRHPEPVTGDTPVTRCHQSYNGSQ